MRIITTACVCAALTAFVCPADAASVPAQLYNKTITVSFVNTNNGVDENGKGTGAGRQINQTIYISSQGRIFMRGDHRAACSGCAQTFEQAPEATAGAFRYDGSRLVRVSRGS
jgi:hypothetical protein